MKKALTQSQIVAALSDKLMMKKGEVQNFLNELTAMALRESKVGFTFPGLGKLVLSQRKERWGRNPATGEKIKIAAKKVLKFRVSKKAKEAVL